MSEVVNSFSFPIDFRDVLHGSQKNANWTHAALIKLFLCTRFDSNYVLIILL